jgi:hypothetical protein
VPEFAPGALKCPKTHRVHDDDDDHDDHHDDHHRATPRTPRDGTRASETVVEV